MDSGKGDMESAEFEDAEYDDVANPTSYSTLMTVTIMLGVALIAVATAFFLYYRNTTVALKAMTESSEPVQIASQPADAENTTIERPSTTQSGESDEPSTTDPVITSPRIDTIEAYSSNKSSNYGKYGTRMMIDGDSETAWNASWKGAGKCWVKVVLKEESQVGSVGLIPGYAKTSHPTYGSVFKLNHRLKDVEFVFPSGKRVNHTFEDSPVMQAVRVEPPESCKEFTLNIKSVYPTQKWGDIAVSELEVSGQ